MAEQQRAKSEIEAALTIAAARPRDQKAAMDNILIQCQRPNLAAKSQYQYAKGGTDISGPTIDLMEVVAQCWGNLEFGFRELQRFAGRGGQPGESVVEAFSWDLQTNTRRRTQFVVSHSERTKRGLKLFTDPRDVYEYVANQAQRRVRTTLENIIPRDIVESAIEECDKTLKASIADPAKAVVDMLKAFAPMGVSREMIEGRIQRRLDAITPAQIVALRKIYTSLKDGMSEPADWFELLSAAKDGAKPQKPAEKAKNAMREKAEEASRTKAKESFENMKAQGGGSQEPVASPQQADQSVPPGGGGPIERSEPATVNQPKPAPEAAKLKLPPEREPGEDDESLTPSPENADYIEQLHTSKQTPDYARDARMWLTSLNVLNTTESLNDALVAIPNVWPEAARQRVADAITAKLDVLQRLSKEEAGG